MLMDEKPDLNEDLLIHFGVRGMKWGHRKKRPDEEERKKFFNSRNKKIAAGAAVAITGAAAVIFILGSRGKQRLPSLDHAPGLKEFKNVAKNVGSGNRPRLSDAVGRSYTPHLDASPFAMQIQAGRIAQQSTMNRIGTQRLVDQTWRDSAKMKQLTRDMNSSTNMLLKSNAQQMSIADIRRKLNDPNHVWEL